MEQLLEQQKIYKIQQLDENAKKFWDLFYKRNEDRFFKDRHWSIKEFETVILEFRSKVLLEIGCGVGNFIYPLLENFGPIFQKVYACDLSEKAIELLKKHKSFDEDYIMAFQCDITDADNLLKFLPRQSVDLITMIFVLSAINPNNFENILKNLFIMLHNDGLVILRDYAVNDSAQVRFNNSNKISDNWYARQDGTRSYFFNLNELRNLFENVGYKIESCEYVKRRTINIKKNLDAPRNFIQIYARKC